MGRMQMNEMNVELGARSALLDMRHLEHFGIRSKAALRNYWRLAKSLQRNSEVNDCKRLRLSLFLQLNKSYWLFSHDYKMAALLLALNGELRHILPRLVWFHNASTETVPSFHNATSLGRLSRNVEKVTGKKKRVATWETVGEAWCSDAKWWNLWKLNETMQVPKPEIKIHKVCHAGMTFNIQKQVWNTHINHNTTILTDTGAHTRQQLIHGFLCQRANMCWEKKHKTTRTLPSLHQTSRQMSSRQAQSIRVSYVDKIDLVLDKLCANFVSFFLSLFIRFCTWLNIDMLWHVLSILSSGPSVPSVFHRSFVLQRLFRIILTKGVAWRDVFHRVEI